MARQMFNKWAGPAQRQPTKGGEITSEDDFVRVQDAAQITKPSPLIQNDEPAPGISGLIDNFFQLKLDELAEKKKKEKEAQTDGSWHAVSVRPKKGVQTVELSHHYSASAVLYPHEEWLTFRHKARDLVDLRFGSEGEIKVRPIHGGSYNRVVRVLVDGEARYILRIPRRPETADVEGEVAPLLFLQRHTPLITPRVATYDNTDANMIQSPYMIQELIPGICLYPAYYAHDILKGADRLRIAHDLGVVFRQLLETRNNIAGRLVFPPKTQAGVNAEVCVVPIRPKYKEPWHLHSPIGAKPWEPQGPVRQSVADFMRTMLDTRLDNARKCWPKNYKTHQRLERLKEIVTEMENKGYLNDVQYSLYHWDIAGRNIIFNPDAAKTETSLGMIDWDDCVFMPSFMLYRPPSWIWTLRYYKFRGNSMVEEVKVAGPAHEALCIRLKQEFESAAGPEYKKYCEGPVYNVARKICQYSVQGTKLKTDERGETAAELEKKWQQFLRVEPYYAREKKAKDAAKK
ncbi:Protein kinase-like domain containing protein [Rhypophila sp. PSN 637]